MAAVIPHPYFFFVVNIMPFYPDFDGVVAIAILVFPIAGRPTLDGAVFIMPAGVVAGAIIMTVANFHTAAMPMMAVVAIFPDVMADAAHNDAAEKTSESRPAFIARLGFGSVGQQDNRYCQNYADCFIHGNPSFIPSIDCFVDWTSKFVVYSFFLKIFAKFVFRNLIPVSCDQLYLTKT